MQFQEDYVLLKYVTTALHFHFGNKTKLQKSSLGKCGGFEIIVIVFSIKTDCMCMCMHVVDMYFVSDLLCLNLVIIPIEMCTLCTSV